MADRGLPTPAGTRFTAGPTKNISMRIVHRSGRLRAHEISFCVTPYHLKGGTRVPEIPDQCPYRAEGPCHVVLDHLRERQTGPGFPLYVLRCQGHARGYTLYPPGYGPYAQESLVAVTPEGMPTMVSEEAPTVEAKPVPVPEPGPELTRFRPTYLGASVDAAEGRFWPSGAGEQAGVALRYPTQIRRIARALVGLGVAPDLDPADRLRISQQLNSGLVGKEEARQLNDVSINQLRATAVCRVLTTVREGWKAVRALTHSFYLAGIWGLPFFWDQQARVLRTEPFRRSGIGGAVGV